MMRATELAHVLIRRTVKPEDRVVDATVGNGHDTLMLADLVGPSGHVYGFDVQKAALDATAQRVGSRPQVTLIRAGHETLAEHIPTGDVGLLSAVMFNLGYLPGAPRDIVTRAETTLAALEQSLDRLAPCGLVTLVLYPGHSGGAEEAAAIRSFAENLPEEFTASHYARINTRRPAPELLAIERRD